MRLLSGLFDTPVSLPLLQAHFDALDREKLLQVLLFDARIRPRGLVYYRPDGPFEHVGALRHELRLPLEASVLGVVGTRGTLKGRQVGVILTPKCLPESALRQHGLTVDFLHGYMPLLERYMETHRALAFAGTGAVGVKNDAYLLFRNPRKLWQFSTFSPGVGPVGHTEGKTVEEALQHATALRSARPDDGAYLRLVMAAPDVFDEPEALDGLLAGAVSPAGVSRAMRHLAAKVRRCGITRRALRAGMAVELEHRDVTHGDFTKTARIAAAHLCESPRYYQELAKMERRLARHRRRGTMKGQHT